MQTHSPRCVFPLLCGFLAGVLLSNSSFLIRSTILLLDRFVWKTESLRNEAVFLEVEAAGSLLNMATSNFNSASFSRSNEDDTSVADGLFRKIKILCLVVTYPENHKKKAIHVNATWGTRCNKLLFVTRTTYENLPTLVLNVTDGRRHLGDKMRAMFDHAYKHYVDDYHWFLKADDDTYVIMENLRYFLSAQDYNSPVFFGQTFLKHIKQGYASGGAGYVASREALRIYGRRNNETMGCVFNSGAEDIDFGRCMESLGVRLGNSLDALGRTRFHCFRTMAHIHGRYTDWFRESDEHRGTKKGVDSLSDYAITFHYMNSSYMHLMEYFVYRMKSYGIIKGLHDLNANDTTV